MNFNYITAAEALTLIPKMSRTPGDSLIHYSQIDKMVFHEAELPVVDYSTKIK